MKVLRVAVNVLLLISLFSVVVASVGFEEEHEHLGTLASMILGLFIIALLMWFNVRRDRS